MWPLCLQPAAVQICPYVLNGALLLEHNVAYYLEHCSESVGSIIVCATRPRRPMNTPPHLTPAYMQHQEHNTFFVPVNLTSIWSQWHYTNLTCKTLTMYLYNKNKLKDLAGFYDHIRLNCSSFFLVLLFSSFLFDSCDRLSRFYQLLNCTWNPCTFLSWTRLSRERCNWRHYHVTFS